MADVDGAVSNASSQNSYYQSPVDEDMHLILEIDEEIEQPASSCDKWGTHIAALSSLISAGATGFIAYDFLLASVAVTLASGCFAFLLTFVVVLAASGCIANSRACPDAFDFSCRRGATPS